MNKLICESCYKIKEKHELYSICSFSETGNFIVNYICKKCLNNPNNFNKLIESNDKKLDFMDLKIHTFQN